MGKEGLKGVQLGGGFNKGNVIPFDFINRRKLGSSGEAYDDPVQVALMSRNVETRGEDTLAADFDTLRLGILTFMALAYSQEYGERQQLEIQAELDELRGKFTEEQWLHAQRVAESRVQTERELFARM